MQCFSSSSLSDEESVRTALPIIEEIWIGFIEKRYQRFCDPNDPSDTFPINFNDTFYSYLFCELESLTKQNFPSLYSRYVGTKLINTEPFFIASSAFVQTEEYLEQSDVVHVSGRFPFSLSTDRSNTMPLEENPLA
jgi:hypothetical protein